MRHLQRHLSRTIADLLVTELTALGWVDSPVNFGTQPVSVRNVDPTDANTAQQTPNLVSVWINNEGPTTEYELGGGLREVELALEVHLWGVNPSVAMALAGDIKDVLRDHVGAVTDYAETPPVDSDVQVELDGVFIERPVGSVTASDFKRNWRIVSSLARCYLVEP